MKILVSYCLLGENCKYNGKNNKNEELIDLLKGHEIFPACPEVLGGLPTPRPASEIKDGKVINNLGQSVDKEFRLGAEKALKIALENELDLAILQERSPSCGTRKIYDGSFSGRLIDGQGIFARELAKENIPFFGSDQIKEIKEFLENLARS